MSDMWFMEMDYSKRHCWQGKDGVYFRDGASILEKFPHCEDWYKHPFKAGHTYFLRWIRNLGTLTENLVTGGADIDFGPRNLPYSETPMYCENYGDKLFCYLDVNEGTAYVYAIPELEDVCRRAKELTDMEYADMLANVPAYQS